jgi:hypothetical protein
MPEIIYAVHTKTCTYLLDDDGVCRWIVSATGMVPPDVRRCIGAQFVASLDLRLPGGLAGELRLGAFALFVAPREDDPTKLVLLRTAPIQYVEFRDPADPTPLGSTPRPLAPPEQPTDLTDDAVDDPSVELKPEDLVMYTGEEATVTLTLPLFRVDGGGRGLPTPHIPKRR